MGYKEVDIDTWVRRETYLHFTQEINCTICLTTNIDVTPVVKLAERTGKSSYIMLLYCIGRVINAHDEFKMSYHHHNEKQVRLWDSMAPSHNVFHKETETFTNIWTDWNEDFEAFYAACTEDIEKGRATAVHTVPGIPDNVFSASCVPWLSYSALTLHMPATVIFISPIVSWGKYEEVGGKIQVPMTMQIHHAVADGFHVARFFKEVEQEVKALLNV